MKKENAIRYYRKFSGAERYLLGIIVDHELYLADVEEIAPRMISVIKASSRNGGGEKLQFTPKVEYKKQLIKKGAIHLGHESILEGEYNKGVELERIICEMNNQEFRGKDSVRFDKGGDLNINGIEYQVKLQGAQIVAFSTLNKIQKERRMAK